MNCALWGKSIKLGRVKAQVVTIIFSYGPHRKMGRGRHGIFQGWRDHGRFGFSSIKDPTKGTNGLNNSPLPFS